MTSLAEIGRFLEQHNGAVTATATVLIAIFTVVLAIVTARQAKLTRESIDLARAEFLATHRPRIRVRWVNFARADTENTAFEICIVNVGESTATIIEVGIYAGFLTYDGCFGTAAPPLKQPTESLPLTLKSGELVVFRRETEHPVRDWASISRCGDFFVVDGTFSYKDELGLVRHTGFCRGQREEGGFKVFEPNRGQDYED